MPKIRLLSSFLFSSTLLITHLLHASEVLIVQDVLNNSKHKDHHILKQLAPRIVGLEYGGSGTVLDTNKDGQAMIFTAKHVVSKEFLELVGGLSFSIDDFDFIVDGNYYGTNPYQTSVSYNNTQYLGYKILVPQTTPLEVTTYEGALPTNDYSIVLASGAQIETNGPYTISLQLEKTAFPIQNQNPIKTANASIGQNVILLGKPENKSQQLSYTKGKVLTTEEAKYLLENSADIIERTTPFDPETEFVVDASTSSGFSGGGVFNEKGEYLGIIVRGDVIAGKFTRVLRVSYVIRKAKYKFKKSIDNHPELTALTKDTLLQIN